MKLQKGFTLIELLIIISISAVVGVILINFLVQSNGLFYTQNAKVNQELSINQSLEQIRNSIRSASGIATSYPSNPSYVTGANILVLTLPAINGSGNVIDNVFDYVVIVKDSQNEKILRKYVFPDASSSRKSENQVLTTRLFTIQYNYYDSNGGVVSPTAAAKVNVVLTQKEKGSLGYPESSASAEINLRNN